MSYDVEKLRATQLQILDYIVGVCKSNHLRYFLYFGSLLGAVRHQGYIPWDDDLDIACLRQDYDKLVDILVRNQSKDSKFYIQSIKTDPSSPVLHTKVRMNNTECIELNAVSETQHKGIFVDIFPLDEYKNSLAYKVKANIIRILYSARGDAIFPTKKRGVKGLLRYPIAHFSVETYNRAIGKLIHIADSKHPEYLTCYICRYKAQDCWIDRRWVTRVQNGTFENRQYCLPFDSESVLRKLYGRDYMVPPPENKRISHEYQSVTWKE